MPVMESRILIPLQTVIHGAANARRASTPVATEPVAATTEPATTEGGDLITKPAAPESRLVNAKLLAAPTATNSEAAAPMSAKPKRPRKAAGQTKEKKLLAAPTATNSEAAAPMSAKPKRPRKA